MTLDDMERDAYGLVDLCAAVIGEDRDELLKRPDVRLARAVLLLLPVVRAALMWHVGMVRLPDGRLIDSDDGNADQGLMRRPAREELLAALDHLRAQLETK